jgi:hypothetical protein
MHPNCPCVADFRHERNCGSALLDVTALSCLLART